MACRPVDGRECLAERRIRDRQRVMAKHWRRAKRMYPDKWASCWGEQRLHMLRERFVRDRFKPGERHRYWKDANPRRVMKEMSLAEKRGREFAAEQCKEAGARCKLTRFRS